MNNRLSKEDWEALFRQRIAMVERYFALHGVRPADADDLSQEVFKGLAQCMIPSEPHTYILAIARKVLSRHRRRRMREHAALSRYFQHCRANRQTVGSRAFREGTPEEGSPDELEEFLKTMAGKLPQHYFELVVLRFREGLSVGQIAQRMECSEDAVWKRLQRLRIVLQRHYWERIAG
jgi:RNA polymerase sigma factor (sigma-70 family)